MIQTATNCIEVSPVTILILDTELTSWKGAMERNWSGPHEYREIVQIGAIHVEETTGETVGEPYEQLVMPRINYKLSQYFIDLTGITQKVLEEHGVDFTVAFGNLMGFAGSENIWSHGLDTDIINENIELYNLQDELPRLSGYDLKPWFVKCGLDYSGTFQGENLVSGNLASCLGIDVNMPGAAHNALFDVYSLQAVIRHYLERGYQFPENGRLSRFC